MSFALGKVNFHSEMRPTDKVKSKLILRLRLRNVYLLHKFDHLVRYNLRLCSVFRD